MKCSLDISNYLKRSVVFPILLFSSISLHVIDYVICSQRWRRSTQSTKTTKKNRADCGSDHELLIEKSRLKLKKVGKTTRSFMYDLNQILIIIM